jgi:hypothetical protein
MGSGWYERLREANHPHTTQAVLHLLRQIHSYITTIDVQRTGGRRLWNSYSTLLLLLLLKLLHGNITNYMIWRGTHGRGMRILAFSSWLLGEET